MTKLRGVKEREVKKRIRKEDDCGKKLKKLRGVKVAKRGEEGKENCLDLFLRFVSLIANSVPVVALELSLSRCLVMNNFISSASFFCVCVLFLFCYFFCFV